MTRVDIILSSSNRLFCRTMRLSVDVCDWGSNAQTATDGLLQASALATSTASSMSVGPAGRRAIMGASNRYLHEGLHGWGTKLRNPLYSCSQEAGWPDSRIDDNNCRHMPGMASKAARMTGAHSGTTQQQEIKTRGVSPWLCSRMYW